MSKPPRTPKTLCHPIRGVRHLQEIFGWGQLSDPQEGKAVFGDVYEKVDRCLDKADHALLLKLEKLTADNLTLHPIEYRDLGSWAIDAAHLVAADVGLKPEDIPPIEDAKTRAEFVKQIAREKMKERQTGAKDLIDFFLNFISVDSTDKEWVAYEPIKLEKSTLRGAKSIDKEPRFQKIELMVKKAGEKPAKHLRTLRRSANAKRRIWQKEMAELEQLLKPLPVKRVWTYGEGLREELEEAGLRQRR